VIAPTTRRALRVVASVVFAVATLLSTVPSGHGPAGALDAAPGASGVGSTSPAYVAGGVCLANVSPSELNRLFVSEPGGVVGADYQRTLELPDGSVLWTFQDAEVRLPSGATTLVHNIGMVQRGSCFSVLMSGTAWSPQPWLFAEYTSRFQRWFWPLGATIGSDGRVYVFAAEMREEGGSYLTRVVPTATFAAAVNPSNWNVEWYGRPGDGSAALYGFSIASDRNWTYLYAQCHRQFGFDPYIFVLAHDRSCTSRVTVARVRRGDVLSAPRYWDGARWRADRSRARPVFGAAGLIARPTQVVFHNNQWMAITKLDDWWGKRIVVEQARRPTGPFALVEQRWPSPKCPRDCNTYFASWIPAPNPGAMFFGLSHNRWDGLPTAVYRPTFGRLDAPRYSPSIADRCSVGYCD
jgi:hypothetical protein